MARVMYTSVCTCVGMYVCRLGDSKRVVRVRVTFGILVFISSHAQFFAKGS